MVITAFLAFYLAGTMVLANTAHQGGRLVHELGVRAAGFSAPQPGQSQPTSAPPEQNSGGKPDQNRDND